MDTLKRLWNGEIGLGRTFWLFGFFVGALLSLTANVIGGTIGQIFNAAGVIWGVFMWVPIWRSAVKYQGAKVWAVLAQISIIISVIGFIAILSQMVF